MQKSSLTEENDVFPFLAENLAALENKAAVLSMTIQATDTKLWAASDRLHCAEQANNREEMLCWTNKGIELSDRSTQLVKEEQELWEEMRRWELQEGQLCSDCFPS